MRENKKRLNSEPLKLRNSNIIYVYKGGLRNLSTRAKYSSNNNLPLLGECYLTKTLSAGDIIPIKETNNKYDQRLYIVSNTSKDLLTFDNLLDDTIYIPGSTSYNRSYTTGVTKLSFQCSSVNKMQYCTLCVVSSKEGDDGNTIRWISLADCTSPVTLPVSFDSGYIDIWVCAPDYTEGSYSYIKHQTNVSNYSFSVYGSNVTSFECKPGYYRIYIDRKYTSTLTTYISFSAPTMVGNSYALNGASYDSAVEPMQTYLPTLYKSGIIDMFLYDSTAQEWSLPFSFTFVGTRYMNSTKSCSYVSVSTREGAFHTPIIESLKSAIAYLIPTEAIYLGGISGGGTLA